MSSILLLSLPHVSDSNLPRNQVRGSLLTFWRTISYTRHNHTLHLAQGSIVHLSLSILLSLSPCCALHFQTLGMDFNSRQVSVTDNGATRPVASTLLFGVSSKEGTVHKQRGCSDEGLTFLAMVQG